MSQQSPVLAAVQRYRAFPVPIPTPRCCPAGHHAIPGGGLPGGAPACHREFRWHWHLPPGRYPHSTSWCFDQYPSAHDPWRHSTRNRSGGGLPTPPINPNTGLPPGAGGGANPVPGVGGQPPIGVGAPRAAQQPPISAQLTEEQEAELLRRAPQAYMQRCV